MTRLLIFIWATFLLTLAQTCGQQNRLMYQYIDADIDVVGLETKLQIYPMWFRMLLWLGDNLILIIFCFDIPQDWKIRVWIVRDGKLSKGERCKQRTKNQVGQRLLLLLLWRWLWNICKILVREVLSDRYRIAHEKFQYHWVELFMTFRVFTLYNSH